MTASALVLFLLTSGTPQASDWIPSELKGWVPWVLHGAEDSLCPEISSTRTCLALSRVEVAVHGNTATWSVEGWRWSPGSVPLPGDDGTWPQAFSGSTRLPVVSAGEGSEARPSVRVGAGPFRIRGTLGWSGDRSSIPLPPGAATEALTRDGRPLESRDHQLWLESAPVADRSKTADSSLRVRVFRSVSDGVPMRVTTTVRIEAGGAEREVSLDGMVPAGALPTEVQGDLPADMDRAGHLRVHLRPGTWSVTASAVWVVPPSILRPSEASSPWPQSEIWSFEPDPSLRTVEVNAPHPVDARQAGVPGSDGRLPTWNLGRGEEMALRETLRGKPKTDSVQAALRREVWIDFQGGGMTLVDHLDAGMSNPQRISVRPGFRLCRAQDATGRPILLGSLGSGEQGFPVQGTGAYELQLRREGSTWGSFPVSSTGWDLGKANLRVHLGPGWRLLSISGGGASWGSWFDRWNLWNIFMVVLAVGLVARLGSKRSAVLAGAVLVLGCHDGIGVGHWLHALAALGVWALLREKIPGSGPTRVASLWALLASLVLVGVQVGFTVGQMRLAMHPALEWTGVSEDGGFIGALGASRKAAEARDDQTEAKRDDGSADLRSVPSAPASSPDAMSMVRLRAKGTMGMSEVRTRPAAFAPEEDPAGMRAAQVGVGVPDGRQGSAEGNMEWEGFVRADKTCRIVALSPAWLRMWRIFTVLGAWALLVVLFRRRFPVLAVRAGGFLRPGPAAALLLLFLPGAVRAQIPAADVLSRLRERLLEPAPCGDACARAVECRVRAQGDRLSVEIDVEAQSRAVLRLPKGDWRHASTVVPHGAAGADSEGTWAVVEPGFQTLRLEGEAAGDRFVLDLTDLDPARVRVEAPGWRDVGDREESVQLVRDAARTSSTTRDTTRADLAPLALVRREITLSREWRCRTTVSRASGSTGPLAVPVPLVAGEEPVGKVVVAGKAVQAVVPAGSSETSWESRLPMGAGIRLQAMDSGAWTETWSVRTSAQWHFQARGLPAAGDGAFWSPLPRETLWVAVTRPVPLEGAGLVVRSANLEASGADLSGESLSAQVETSAPSDLLVALPEGARLRSVTVGNAAQEPARAPDGRLRVSLPTGTSFLQVSWTGASRDGIWRPASAASLSAAGTNFTTTLPEPRDGWVVALGGPGAGPAILWWGVLAAMALLSWLLSRIPGQPLGFWSWFLLFAGTSTVQHLAAAPFAIWVVAIVLRARGLPERWTPRGFRIAQIGLAGLTAFSFLCLLSLVPTGLLGRPETFISEPGPLSWFVDRSTGALPRPWMVVLPLWLWRALLLAWSLWLVRSLLAWSRWSWQAVAVGGLWKSDAPVPPKEPEPEP
jgi:hypothetical protein